MRGAVWCLGLALAACECSPNAIGPDGGGGGGVAVGGGSGTGGGSSGGSSGGTAAAGGGAATGGAGGSTSTVAWRLAAPDQRGPTAFGYDAARQRTILFGGLLYTGNAGSTRETWAWDGSGWTQLFPSHAPSGEGPMVYDSARQRLVMFDGTRTWAWDGVDWSLVSDTGPTMAGELGLAYDSHRDRVVLFGGRSAGGDWVDETWELDGTFWVLHLPAARPSKRGVSGMVYDPVRRKTVLFGGSDGMPLRDTWLWDGTSWTEASPAHRPAPVGFDTQLVWHEGRQRVLWVNGDPTQLAEWDGSDWSFISTSGWARRVVDGGSQLGEAFAATYDSAREAVLVLGQAFTPYSNELWKLPNGENVWAPASSAPDHRAGAALVWMPTRQRVLLHGGTGARDHAGSLPGGTQGTWEWDGRTWTRTNLTGTVGTCARCSSAYDDRRARALVVTTHGLSGFDGRSWISRPLPAFVTAASAAGLAYDSVADRVLLLTTEGVVYAYDWIDMIWAPRVVARTPPVGPFASFAFDPLRRRAVLFDAASDTVWELDGAQWSTRPSNEAALAGCRTTDCPLVWSEVRKELVLVWPERGLWSWNGQRWLAVGPPVPRPAEHGAAVATDPMTGEVLVFGGHHPLLGSSTSNLWRLEP